jgi:hypothetical protein
MNDFPTDSPLRMLRGDTFTGWRDGPRPRDFWIWTQVREFGRSGEEVGRQLGLSRARVSQICQRIDRWLSHADGLTVCEFDGEYYRTYIHLVRMREQLIRTGHLPPSRDVRGDVMDWLELLLATGRRGHADLSTSPPVKQLVNA